MSDSRETVIELPLDPSILSTAQQKRISFNQRRVFCNPKVTRTKRLVALCARPHRSAVHAAVRPGCPVALEAVFRYAYPKGTAKMRRADGVPKVNGADVDNVMKAVLDALGDDHGNGAGWWPDDRLVCDLRIRKVYTTGEPRITLSVTSPQPVIPAVI